MIRKTLILIKIMFYFFYIVKAQVIVFLFWKPKSYESSYVGFSNHYKIFWIVIEVLFFYFNIFSMFLFAVITRPFSFQTLKDRRGFGGNDRRTSDFLEHCQDDIHWFTI